MGHVLFGGGKVGMVVPVPILLTSITITTPPTTTTYTEGDNFSADGMVVTATYSNGKSAVVSDYTVLNGTNMAAEQTSVTISYTVNGITATATQNITVKPLLDAVFANNTWEQIISACQSNAVPSTWAVGDQKTMTIGGHDYPIDIIGKNHDTYSDGSGNAPLTFQMHNVWIDQLYMNTYDTNSGGWQNSYMRVNHLPSIKAKMPSSVKAGLKYVSKVSTAGSRSTSLVTTSDDLFLLSEQEVFGAKTDACASEGTQYAYYKNGNSKTKTTNFGSAAYNWWERSPANGMEQFCMVYYSPAASSTQASNNLGVAFAFCF